MKLTNLGWRYTAKVALVRNLPLRKFKISELVVHPYNVRPETGKSDLIAFAEQLRAAGQLDPIHVVPFKDGWAIMEGQRRWLAAPMAGLTELFGWEHPMPADPYEVYAFGKMIHRSRRDTAALDQATVWGRMIEDGLFSTAADLARRECVDESAVSRSLSILKMPPSVLDEVRTAPVIFSDRHLYAITQIYSAGGQEAALGAVRSVITAPPDKPVSGRKLEALASSYIKNGKAPTRGRRRNSVPIAIRSTDGSQTLGSVKAFHDGRFEFKPDAPLSEADAERLAEAIKSTLATELQKLKSASVAALTQESGLLGRARS